MLLLLGYRVRIMQEVNHSLANIKSAIKRVALTRARTKRNKGIKSGIKTRIKRFRSALEEGGETADIKLREAISAIDKAVTKGVLHRNTAARKKSNLQRQKNRVQSQ